MFSIVFHEIVKCFSVVFHENVKCLYVAIVLTITSIQKEQVFTRSVLSVFIKVCCVYALRKSHCKNSEVKFMIHDRNVILKNHIVLKFGQ